MDSKSFHFEPLDDDDGGTIKAYVSTWDRVPDAVGDVVARGAFDATLTEWEHSGKHIPLLYGHDFSDPYSNIGYIVDAVDDDKGLLITANFDPDNAKSQYVRKLVLDGRISKMSFAYETLESGEVTLDDGTVANELRRLKLLEVSIVPVPANENAEIIDVKQAPDCQPDDAKSSTDDSNDDVTRTAGTSGDADIYDKQISIVQLYAMITQMSEHINALSETIHASFENLDSQIRDVTSRLSDIDGYDGRDISYKPEDPDGDKSEDTVCIADLISFIDNLEDKK